MAQESSNQLFFAILKSKNQANRQILLKWDPSFVPITFQEN